MVVPSGLCLRMTSRYMKFIIVWNVAGEFVSPKYITVGSKSLYLVLNAAFFSSPSWMCTLLYPHRMSSFVYICALLRSHMRSAINGRGYWLHIVMALILL